MNCLIYTYGGHERGMGHIYQSKALATELEQAGAQVKFIVPDVPEGVCKLREWDLDMLEISYESSDEEKISQLESGLAGRTIDVVVFDVLESSPALMRYMKTRAGLLVSLDDIGEGRDYADLIINVIHHPPRRAEACYEEINELNYAIIRADFAKAHKVAKIIPPRVGRILVSQGGSDTFGGLVGYVKALELIPMGVEICLLAGSAFRHDDELQEAMQSSARPFAVCRDVEDMAGLMQATDLAITGSGKTVFELAAVGVPFVLVTEEPRELETAEIVARDVLCKNLGLRQAVGAEKIAETVLSLIDDQEQRAMMSQSCKAAVDGLGAWRSARAIAEKYNELKNGTDN
jgi:UDP-2,4-diacetamido-2,4,6-trideoxy-beta-L-altropyranose hydrolase